MAILERLDEELTAGLVARLVAYCATKARRRSWYGILAGADLSMAEGHRPEDIVQTVVEKTLQGARGGPGVGGRVWDGARDLYDYLTSQIDSELSNLRRSWVNRKFQLGRSLERVSDEEEEPESYFETLADTETEDPGDIALRREMEKQADDFVSGFLESLDDDDFLGRVVEQILDGIWKPREVAAALEVPVEDIYNARKRLRRRFDEYKPRDREKEVGSG